MKRTRVLAFGIALGAIVLTLASLSVPAFAQTKNQFGGTTTLQPETVGPVSGGTITTNTQTFTQNSDGTNSTGTGITTTTALPAATAPTAAAPAAAPAQTKANTSTPPSSGTVQPPGFMDQMMQTVVEMFGGLVGFAGLALNVSAYWTIVKMGFLVGNLSALQVAWGTFRDLGNIVILFGFIFMGIATILDSAGYNAKKMLVTLIIVAVTINFSSLAARAVIDAGNIVGIQFYKAFAGGTIPTSAPSDNGIANSLMNTFSLQTLYNNNNFNGQYLLIGFLSLILFIVITVVFFALAFLFVARFVVLVFLITVSPLAFAGFVIPKLKPKSEEWLSLLINNTIVAPIVLLFLLVSTKIVTSGTFINMLSGDSWGAFAQSPAGTATAANIVIVFMIACGFYIASLIVAKQLSAFGATTMMNGVGFVTSQSLGSFGRGTGRIIRRVPGLGRYGQRLVDVSQNATFGGHTSLKAYEAEGKTVKEEIKKEKLEKEMESRKKGAKSGLKAAQQERDNARGDAAIAEANHKIASILSKQSTQELEELDGIKGGVEALVENLSPQQFKNLMESKTLTESQKAKIRTARFASVNRAIAAAEKNPGDKTVVDEAKKKLASMTTKELENADPAFLESDFVAENMTDKQYEDLSKDGALNPTTRSNLDKKRKGRFEAGASDASVADRIIAMKGDTDQIGKIPDDVFMRPGVLSRLSLDEFDAIRRANKIKKVSVRQAIGAHINAARMGDAAFISYFADPRAKQWFFM